MSDQPPLAPEAWGRNADTIQDAGVTNSNFFVWCGTAGIVVFVALILWALVT